MASYLGALALAILAYAGFTTITNSGEEVKKPHKNVGRAIIISLLICAVVYVFVAIAVAANLSVPRIIEAKDYSLAEAARPAFGKYGLWFTVGIAILATVSSVVANVFAISRMTAMLTKMKLIPHSHFGMPGSIQKHTLVYTVLLGLVLTVFFDLSRIASLGIIFYLVMDTAIHWGVLKHLRNDIQANPVIPSLAICLNMLLLAGFGASKWQSDPLVIWVALAVMAVIWLVEYFFLKKVEQTEATHSHH